MSLTIPTTSALADAIIAQIESKLSITVPLLPKSFSHVWAKVQAGVDIILWKYASWIFLQTLIPYATFEEVTINGKRIRPLVQLGRRIGVSDPTAATRAELVITVTVTEQTGALAAQTACLRSETGVSYRTLTAVDLDAATVTVSIRANGDQDGTGGVGTQGNLQVGDELTFAGTPANVQSTVTVASITTTASDAETGEEYRARVWATSQAKPQGGAYADYRSWAESVAGIIHAYPYTSDTPGLVDVYCEASLATADDTDGTPTAAKLTAIGVAINMDVAGKATRRPVNDAVNVQAITRTGFDVGVASLDAVADGDTSGMQTAVTAAVQEWLWSREPYIEGLSVLPRKDIVSQGEIAGVVTSVVNARGGTVGLITLAEGGVAFTYRNLEAGEKAKLADGQPVYT